jgi:hypothetical protein
MLLGASDGVRGSESRTACTTSSGCVSADSMAAATVGPTDYVRHGGALVPRTTPRTATTTWESVARLQAGPPPTLVPVAVRDA